MNSSKGDTGAFGISCQNVPFKFNGRSKRAGRYNEICGQKRSKWWIESKARTLPNAIISTARRVTRAAKISAIANEAIYGPKMLHNAETPRRNSDIVNTSVKEISSCATADFFLVRQSYGGQWRSYCTLAKLGLVWSPHSPVSWFFGVHGLLFMFAMRSLVFSLAASLVSIVLWRRLVLPKKTWLRMQRNSIRSGEREARIEGPAAPFSIKPAGRKVRWPWH